MILTSELLEKTRWGEYLALSNWRGPENEQEIPGCCQQLDALLAKVECTPELDSPGEEFDRESASVQLDNFFSEINPVDACVILRGGLKGANLYAGYLRGRENSYVLPRFSHSNAAGEYIPFLHGRVNASHSLLLLEEDCVSGRTISEVVGDLAERGYDRSKIHVFLRTGVSLSPKRGIERMYSGPIVDTADEILRLCCARELPDFPFADERIRNAQRILYPVEYSEEDWEELEEDEDEICILSPLDERVLCLPDAWWVAKD